MFQDEQIATIVSFSVFLDAAKSSCFCLVAADDSTVNSLVDAIVSCHPVHGVVLKPGPAEEQVALSSTEYELSDTVSLLDHATGVPLDGHEPKEN